MTAMDTVGPYPVGWASVAAWTPSISGKGRSGASVAEKGKCKNMAKNMG